MLALSFLSSCQKSTLNSETAKPGTNTKTRTSAAAGTANISVSSVKGLNWADPNDNFSTGNVIPTGLSSPDSYATTQSKASTILTAFQHQGANTIPLPINIFTVNSGWWSAYTGAIDQAVSMGLNVILG